MHQKLSGQFDMCYDPVMFIKGQGYTETEESNLPGELEKASQRRSF